MKKLLIQDSFIGSFNIKKNTLTHSKLKYLKKPIAVLYDKKNKFYLSENIDLIRYKKLSYFQDLPFVFGNRIEFKNLYNNLIKINFPFKNIKSFSLYEISRWDLKMVNGHIIKLPLVDYTKSLQNYLELMNKNNYKKYKVFDYRIDNQLILK